MESSTSGTYQVVAEKQQRFRFKEALCAHHEVTLRRDRRGTSGAALPEFERAADLRVRAILSLSPQSGHVTTQG